MQGFRAKVCGSGSGFKVVGIGIRAWFRVWGVLFIGRRIQSSGLRVKGRGSKPETGQLQVQFALPLLRS